MKWICEFGRMQTGRAGGWTSEEEVRVRGGGCFGERCALKDAETFILTLLFGFCSSSLSMKVPCEEQCLLLALLLHQMLHL